MVHDTPTGPMRRLVVFDGLAVVDTDHPARFDVRGFYTPDTGPTDATLGGVAYEGDATLTGDTATIDGQAPALPLQPPSRPRAVPRAPHRS